MLNRNAMRDGDFKKLDNCLGLERRSRAANTSDSQASRVPDERGNSKVLRNSTEQNVATVKLN